MRKAVARTLPVARKQILALPALPRQRRALGLPKGMLAFRVHHTHYRVSHDIAQLILRKHKVVAHIHIAVPLYRPRMTTRGSQRANARLLSHPVGQRGIEQLYKIRANVLAHPFVKYRTQKASPLLGAHTKVEHTTLAGLSGRRQAAPVGMMLPALHHGRKLQVVTPYLLKKVVKVQRIIAIKVIHHSQRVPLHAMAVQQVNATHHLCPRRPAALVAAVLVVKLLRPVYAHAHKPPLLLKKAAPLICQQRTVCLYAVVYPAAASILLLQLHRPFIERQRTHQRLTAVPRKQHLGHSLRTDIFAHKAFEHLLAHHLCRPVGIKLAFLQIVTIFTGQITTCPRRFGQQIQRRGKW